MSSTGVNIVSLHLILSLFNIVSLNDLRCIHKALLWHTGMEKKKRRNKDFKKFIVISMFFLDSYDVFTPGSIDLVTRPLAAQHEEI